MYLIFFSLQTFVFRALEDKVAELDELFEVHLVSAVSNDGESGSTDTSGASIDDSKSMSQLIIQENDHPYGLLQFSSEVGVPPAADKVIIPVEDIVQVGTSD